MLLVIVRLNLLKSKIKNTKGGTFIGYRTSLDDSSTGWRKNSKGNLR